MLMFIVKAFNENGELVANAPYQKMGHAVQFILRLVATPFYDGPNIIKSITLTDENGVDHGTVFIHKK